MQPLDLVKTRLQLQRTGAAKTPYVGVIDCFRTMYINEGLFSFYKGIVPPILAETPKRAVKVIKLANIPNISKAFQPMVHWLLAIGYCLIFEMN